VPDEKTSRRPRSDGLRNRERLLDAARAAFIAGETDLRFDELAKRAGVGTGTLYRHFPNRDALVEAVYRKDIERLAHAARHLADIHPPLEALREWMYLFVDYIADKQLITPALNTFLGGTTALYAKAGDPIKTAIQTLVTTAVIHQDIDADINPIDYLRALVGISSVAAAPGWEASAKRLVDILLAGSRPIL